MNKSNRERALDVSDEYRDDCLKLRSLLHFELSPYELKQIELLWKEFSGDQCAGWLIVDEGSVWIEMFREWLAS